MFKMLGCGMIHTFATHEDAAIFASAKRAEGRYAEILDECMSGIYGPPAIGGIRVILSEEALPEAGEDDIPPPSWMGSRDGELANTVRMFVVGFTAIGLGVVALRLIRDLIFLIRYTADDPLAGTSALLDLFQFPLILALSIMSLTPLMCGITRWLRDGDTPRGAALFRWMFLALLILFLILFGL